MKKCGKKLIGLLMAVAMVSTMALSGCKEKAPETTAAETKAQTESRTEYAGGGGNRERGRGEPGPGGRQGPQPPDQDRFPVQQRDQHGRVGSDP